MRRLTALVAPLRERRLRRLVGAFLVNELGDGIAVVVLPLLVHAATGSGLLTGAVFALVRAVGLVGRPIGGLLADRLDRVRVLRTTFVVRGGLLVVGLVAGSDAVLVACLVLVAFVGTIDDPSGEAAIREGAGDQAQQVATIRKVSRALSGIVGLTLGGLVVGLAGAEVAVALDVATYGLALAVLPRPASRSRLARPGRRAPGQRAVRLAVASSLQDGRAGLRHLRGHPDLRLVAWTTALSAGVVTALLTVAVVWLDDLAGAPDGAYGVALAGYSTGAVVGLVVAGTIAWRVPLRTMTTRTLAAAGTACALGAVGSDWRVLALSWLAWGIVWGPIEVWGDTRLVAATPDALRGRVYAGVGVLAALGQLVGGLGGGLLADVVDPRFVIVGLGGVFWVVAVAMAVTGIRPRPTPRPGPVDP